MSAKRWAVLGRVLRPQGLKGEVKVACPAAWLDQFSTAGEVTAEKGNARRTLRIESARKDGRFAYVKFAGVDGPEAADDLRDADLLIGEDRLARPPGGGFHAYELLGLGVFDGDGGRLGEVSDVLDLPTCECLVVRTGADREIQIPVLDHVVRSIDREKGRIVVDRRQLSELL